MAKFGIKQNNQKQAANPPISQRSTKITKRKGKAPPTNKKLGPIAISLSGCGFLCSYHIGVLTCFRRHGKALLSRVSMFCGTSSGALIASIMALKPDALEKVLNDVHALALKVPKFYNYLMDKNFNIAERLDALLKVHIPEDISAANGRLVISVTKMSDGSNKLMSQFPSREYLFKCLKATSYIRFYTGNSPPIIDGEKYVDGGYSNNLPIMEGTHTITISPLNGSAKISPWKGRKKSRRQLYITFGKQRINVNMANIWSIRQSLFPEADTVMAYYRRGYRDGMHFLLKRGYYEKAEGTAV